MMVILITSIIDTSLRLSTHQYLRFLFIYPVQELPHAVSNNSKLDEPTGNIHGSIFEALILGLIVEKSHRIVEPFIKIFF